MKKTQVIELLSNIKATFVSFFSILMFVALGVGIFVGIAWTAPALQTSALKVFEEGSFHDFQIQYPYGLTDSDLERLAAVEGVAEIEPSYQSFQEYEHNGESSAFRVQSVGTKIDSLLVKDGVLPKAKDEMAITSISADTLGLQVGDVITFKHDSETSTESTRDTATDAAEGSEPASPMKYLTGDTFTITAIVESPEYIAVEPETFGISTTVTGSVNALAWVDSSSFNASAFRNGFPIVNVRCAELAGRNSFDDAYTTDANKAKSRIEELGDELAPARFDVVHAEALEQIDAAEQKLIDAKQQIEEGEKQIEQGKQELEQGKQELESGKAELAQLIAYGEAQLAQTHQQLVEGDAAAAEAAQKLEAATAELNEGKNQLAQVDAMRDDAQAAVAETQASMSNLQDKLSKGEITQEEYDKELDTLGANLTPRLQPLATLAGATVPTIDHTNIAETLTSFQAAIGNYENMSVDFQGEKITIREARERLAKGEADLQAAQAEYDAKKAELEAGWSQYYAGRQELDAQAAAGQARIEQGEAKVAQGEAELPEAEKKLDDTKVQYQEKLNQYEAGKKQVASMRNSGWTVLGRNANGGVMQASIFSTVMDNLSLSMAALFVIVGLLVTYSAVSRIVHEQVMQIGTKKALGLRSREITLSFMLYSALAVFAGCVVGIAMGVFVVETIITNVLGKHFVMSAIPSYFDITMALVATVLELGLVLAATWVACRNILRKHAVDLLRGEEPPKAKTRFFEKWDVWARMPLFTQTIVNNCLNDKRRVFSTIVGVAGCTALIVTAITLNNDVLKSYDTQYESVYGFNAIAYVDGADDSGRAAEKLAKALQDDAQGTASVLRKQHSFTLGNGETNFVRLLVPADESEFSQLYHMNPTSGGTVDLSADGIWVSEAFASHLGAKVGDTIEINKGDGVQHELRIEGFYHYYLTRHEAVMGANAYEKEFGSAPTPNAVLVDTGDKTVDQVKEDLKGYDFFDSIVDDKEYQQRNFKSFSSVSSSVVLIYLALAALMAIVVLLNLNVMFISEKKRELIVLMINGYSAKAAKRYIANDTVVLTVIGIIAGVILGCVMGSVTVASIEPESASFVKDIDWPAVVAGIVGSAGLALIMSKIALRRVPRFNLTDIDRL